MGDGDNDTARRRHRRRQHDGGWGDDTYYVDNARRLGDRIRRPGHRHGADQRDLGPHRRHVESLETTNASGTAAINLAGNASGNVIVGNNGDNLINGGGGVDQMSGRGGNDIYYVDNSSDVVTESGGQGTDTVRTSVSWTLTAGADVETLATTDDNGVAAINLTGNSSGNMVIGNNGNNVINGGDGDDELIGRGGYDYFVFNTALDAASNVDVLSDFNVADDSDRAGRTRCSRSLGLGALSAGEFVIGPAAQDANDHIIYNSATGALLYDSDGSGATAAVQFAAVGAGLALTSSTSSSCDNASPRRLRLPRMRGRFLFVTRPSSAAREHARFELVHRPFAAYADLGLVDHCLCARLNGRARRTTTRWEKPTVEWSGTRIASAAVGDKARTGDEPVRQPEP